MIARKGPLALSENYSCCSVMLVVTIDSFELNTDVPIVVANMATVVHDDFEFGLTSCTSALCGHDLIIGAGVGKGCSFSARTPSDGKGSSYLSELSITTLSLCGHVLDAIVKVLRSSNGVKMSSHVTS